MPIDLYSPIAGQKVFGADLPDYELLSDCIRCGRCLPVCPTYQQTTLETQSPRGRLNLLRAVEDGKLDLEEPGLEAHLYHCLDCRACNTVCPAGIPVGELIVEGRAAVEHVHPRSRIVRFALNVILISPRRAEFFAAPLRWIQHLKLDRLGVYLLGWMPKLGPTLRDLVQMAPSISKPLRRELTGRLSDYSTTRLHDHSAIRRVGFFLGCVMNVAYADASRASVQLMQRFGCEVVTPKDQLCCGAPHVDQGLKDKARAFARRNIAAFERQGELDAVVADCAACSGFLKEYAHLLRDEPEWADRARRFSSKVRDITEWLDEIMPTHPAWRAPAASRQTGRERSPEGTQSKSAPTEVGTPDQTVTYHEPCHLAYVQGVRRQPRALLARLRGIDLRDLPDATRCCGSAGIYNLTHPTMSRQLLDRKMADVASTGAETVVSANPGCLLQLEWGAKRHQSHIAVNHITQVIWDSMVEREP